MFDKMIGKYIPLDSKIHRMNSVSKIICLLLFLILLLIDNIYLLLCLIILTIIMMLLSKIPLKLYFKNIYSLKVLIIFLIIITFIFHEPWITMIISIIKIILGILYTMIITYTTPKNKITYGLEKIFSPLQIIKVPVKQMSLSLTLALRFIPTIFEQTEKIMKSQASRGIDFKHSSIKGKVIAISSMIVPMFVLTSKRSERIADSMETRSYSLTAARTDYHSNDWHRFDENMIIIHIMLLLYFVLQVIIL